MGAPKSGGTDGRKRRWEKHNAERRQAIIDAAITVLARDIEPGGELSVQQIADEASVHRTVLYRYFNDRTDLDLAIQQEISARASKAMMAATALEGTPHEIVHRIIAAYVGWAVDNVAAMRFLERDVPGAPVKTLDIAIGQMATHIELIIDAMISLLGAEIEDEDRDALTPWAFTLVGGVMAGVRAWLSRDTLRPPEPAFATLMSDVTWLQVQGLAASRNIEVPDVSVEQLLNLKDAP